MPTPQPNRLMLRFLLPLWLWAYIFSVLAPVFSQASLVIKDSETLTISKAKTPESQPSDFKFLAGPTLKAKSGKNPKTDLFLPFDSAENVVLAFFRQRLLPAIIHSASSICCSGILAKGP